MSFLRDRGLDCRSPRDCFREAFSYGLVTEEEVWVQMIRDRNLSVLTYSEELANQLYARLPRYLPAWRQLMAELQSSGGKYISGDSMSSTRYPPHKLDAIFNYIGVQLDVTAELDELGKDDESDLNLSGFLRGITNGEYIWALYEALMALMEVGKQVELSPLQDAIFADIISGIKDLFFDRVLQSDDKAYDDKAYIEESKREIWDLYELAMAHRKASSTLSTPEGDEAEEDGAQWEAPTDLEDEDWEAVFELVAEDFAWETDWDMSPHFSLLDPYPHIPNDQEYRRARFGLLSFFHTTTANRERPK
jgi:hypothetical protein